MPSSSPAKLGFLQRLRQRSLIWSALRDCRARDRFRLTSPADQPPFSWLTSKIPSMMARVSSSVNGRFFVAGFGGRAFFAASRRELIRWLSRRPESLVVDESAFKRRVSVQRPKRLAVWSTSLLSTADTDNAAMEFGQGVSKNTGRSERVECPSSKGCGIVQATRRAAAAYVHSFQTLQTAGPERSPCKSRSLERGDLAVERRKGVVKGTME